LHGESDPRCLLQLLQLFDSVLVVFHSILNDNGNNNYYNNTVIVSIFFDAVSPYYPVQFHPPPNDVHGITRSSLRKAVLRVLSCTLYDTEPYEGSDENMSSLTCCLILDCLVPSSDDEPITYTEQVEILEDLHSFLFDSYGSGSTITILENLDIKQLQHVAEALQKIHEYYQFKCHE
jgi:hypothetical protein